MSEALRVSRLWPVLTVLAGLIAGAMVLERVAEDRAVRPLVIAIHGGSALGPEADPEAGGDALAEAIVDPRQEEARALGRRGEVGLAVERLRAVVRDHPEAAAPRAELAFWLLDAGQTSEALEALDEALVLGPQEARWHLRRGVALGKLGRDAEAEAAYRRALEIRDNFDPARILLGARLRERGELTDARAVLLPATGRGSNAERARAWVELGQVLLLDGKSGGAAEAFERGILLAPAIPELRVGIGRAWLAHGDTEEAKARGLAVLEQAAVLAPDLPLVHDALGRAYERTGRPDEARLAYRRALSLDAQDTYARRRLMRLDMAMQAFASARQQIDHLLAIDDGNPEHHFLAGLLAARSGRAQEGRKAYGRAIELRDGDYPEAYYNLGTLERREGRRSEAKAAYRSALALRPRYKAAWNNLGLTLSDLGDIEGALAAYDEAITVDPDYAVAYLNRGKLLTSLERYDEAQRSLERARALRGDYPAADLDLGVVYLRTDRATLAVRIYEDLVERHPRYLLARYNLGLALIQARRIDAARRSFEAALALDGSHLPSLRRLAALHVEAGRPGQAVPLLRDLLDYAPDDAASRLDLAETLLAQRDLAGCRRELGIVRAAEVSATRLETLERACAGP